MTKSNDLNANFAQLAGFLILGGIASWAATGNSSFLTICIVLYFMLVATNSIKRGEAAGKRR